MEVRWTSKCGKFRIVVGAYGEPRIEHDDGMVSPLWLRVHADQPGTTRIEAFETMLLALALERARAEAIRELDTPPPGGAK